MASSISSPASTLHGNNIYPEGFNINDRSGRNNLTKSQNNLANSMDDLPEGRAVAKRNRFSKRASKNGLSTPF